MEERLESILVWLEEAVKVTGEFLTEQTPLVVQEVLVYHRMYYTTGVVIALLLITSSAFRLWWNWDALLVKVRWSYGDEKPDLSGEACFHYVSMALPTFIGLMLMGMAFDSFLKVWFAPRLFLLEWIRRFV